MKNTGILQLKLTQTGYVYTENLSKKRQGGFGQLKLKNKCVEILANQDATVTVDLYISKLPDEAKSRNILSTPT